MFVTIQKFASYFVCVACVVFHVIFVELSSEDGSEQILQDEDLKETIIDVAPPAQIFVIDQGFQEVWYFAIVVLLF